MRFEKFEMTYRGVTTNSKNDKDYHTILFEDTEGHKEYYNYIGDISALDTLVDKDIVDLYFRIYRSKDNYFNTSIVIDRIKKTNN